MATTRKPLAPLLLATALLATILAAPAALAPAPAHAAELAGGLAAQADTVSYIEYTYDNGKLEPVTQTIGTYATVTPADTQWGSADATYRSVYVVDKDVTLAERVKCSGKVDLVLCDGRSLTAPKGIEVPDGATLRVCGQEKGTGGLTAEAPGNLNYDAGIGGNDRGSCGKVEFHGGTVEVSGGAGGGAGIGGGDHGSGGEVTVYGGTVEASSAGAAAAGIGGGASGSGGTFAVYGGVVTATGGGAGAGIGGGDHGSGGMVAVYGGKVTATSAGAAAGIGGGASGSGGTVAVYGGEVAATGGRGAGIGAGYWVDPSSSATTGTVDVSSGTVEVSGGEVTAKGGEGGAGIGGGYGVSGGTVEISGGEVAATGGYRGAGIGGGDQGAGGTVEISGGEVATTGGGGGAGIGGGYQGAGGTVEVSGGEVTATGGEGGAGIGGGSFGSGGHVEISGGAVATAGGAEGNGYGKGVGRGFSGTSSGDLVLGNGVGLRGRNVETEAWSAWDAESTDDRPRYLSTAHEVSFDANGHGTAPGAQTVAAGQLASDPGSPLATGYSFGGWFSDAACTSAYDFSARVMGDLALYAQWTANEAVALSFASAKVTKTYGDAAFANRLANPSGVKVAYKSSNPNVAAVSSAGKVTVMGAGSATITAKFAGDATRLAASASFRLTVAKAAGVLKVVPAKKKLSAKAGKKTTIKEKKAFKVKANASKGKVTYKKVKGNRKISVSKAGKVTVKKGLKAGKTYAVKVKATSAATANYKAASKTVTLKIKVK